MESRKDGTRTQEYVEMKDSEVSALGLEPRPAARLTDTADKGLNRYLTIGLVAFNLAVLALFGRATIATLTKFINIDSAAKNNDNLNTHSSATVTTRVSHLTSPSPILMPHQSSATRILSSRKIPKMGCRPDRFDNEGNQEGNNKLFAGSYVCSDDADQRYWFGIDPETGNLIWRDSKTGKVKTYYTNEWHKQYLQQKNQQHHRRNQQLQRRGTESWTRRRRMKLNEQQWSHDKIVNWNARVMSKVPTALQARAANELRNLQHDKASGECWEWVQVSRSPNGRVQFEARPIECNNDNPPADHTEDSVGNTTVTDVELDEEEEDTEECFKWVAVADQKSGKIVFTATPSDHCTDPMEDVDANTDLDTPTLLDNEEEPVVAPTPAPTPAPTEELIVDYYFTLSIEATFRIHRIYRTKDYKIVNEVLHYELPSTYDISQVYKNCLFTHDCPYMHLHQDGVMVLAWLDWDLSDYSDGWMEKNIKRCYNFDTKDAL